MSKFTSLKERLENSGWRISQAEIPTEIWWAKEIWILQSTWSPNDKTIYLALMLDPHLTYDENNPSDKNVWSVSLTQDFPTSRIDPNSHDFGVKRKFEVTIGSIVDKANDLRSPHPH